MAKRSGTGKKAMGSKAKKTTGTGLGLPICKRIVHETAGTIEVESELGVGAKFIVRLPAYAEEATE